MHKYKAKVLSGFRVTIPEEARRRLLIRIGQELDFVLEGNRLIYVVKGLPEDPVFSMLELARGEERKLGEVEEAVIGEEEEKLKRIEDEVRAHQMNSESRDKP